jgi:hypothetical protein
MKRVRKTSLLVAVIIWIILISIKKPSITLAQPVLKQSTSTSTIIGSYSNPLDVPFSSQREGAGVTLGFPDEGYPNSCDGSTVGEYGCVLASYVMVYNYYSPEYTDILSFNIWMIEHQ